MKPHTAVFQRALIRAIKEVLTAWEKWLDAAEQYRRTA
jgi:hypothetical protein